MRTQAWLEERLFSLLKTAYSDLTIVNRLEIGFGRAARGRFGSIKMDRRGLISRITINGYFRDESIPEQIVDATIAHELAHYAHGFSSPLPRLYASPHAGGVIEREFRKRGLSLLSAFERQWTKAHWRDYLLRSR